MGANSKRRLGAISMSLQRPGGRKLIVALRVAPAMHR
jgi:hypothetical protein